MNRSKQRNFIYFRYLLGVAIALLMVALMLIPCLEYTVGSQHNEPISAITLIRNSWNTSRTYLFDGGANKVSEQTAFSKALLASVIALCGLFVIGLAASVYTAVCAFSYFRDCKRTDNNRIFFLTLIPNRAVCCIYHALLLPLAFFPRIIVSLYENILNYQTVLRFSPLEPWIPALLLYIGFAVVTAVSAKYEKKLGLDPHYNAVAAERIKRERTAECSEESDEKEEQSPLTIDEVLRAEQTERIRRMLSDDSKDK